MPTNNLLELLANQSCEVGENPLWDERRARLYWTDIDTGRLFYWDAGSGEHRQIYQGEPVGGFTLQEDGSLLLFRNNNVALRTEDGEVHVLGDNIDPEMERFNDVIADPEGRVYAGSIGTAQRGGLYRVDTDLSIQRLWQGTECSNGMGFTPELTHMYWTCTTSGRIYKFRYDRRSGNLSNRDVLIEVPAASGYLDGMSVDTEGRIWSARWGGAAVHCYSADGREVETVPMPVSLVSSVTFGGTELDELYITTAGGNRAVGGDDHPFNGALFRMKCDARGRAPFRSRIAIP